MKAKLAPTIKAICKKYGVKATVGVRHHSTLVLNIASSSMDLLKNYNETVSKRNDFSANGFHEVKNDLQVNTYWAHEHFSGNAKKFFVEVIAAMKGADYFDDSDSQTDYFHCSHYVDINVGQWNKPFVVTK